MLRTLINTSLALAVGFSAGCAGGDPTGTSASGGSRQSAIPTTQSNPTEIEPGRSYRLVLNFHCGIDHISLVGRHWRATTKPLPPPPDGLQLWPDKTRVEVTVIDSESLRMKILQQEERYAKPVMYSRTRSRPNPCN